MPNLNDIPFVCLDCEFTGLNIDEDRVIEIAACQFTLQEEGLTFEAMVNPKCPMTPEAFEIHRISTEMLENKPTIDLVLNDFFEFMGTRLIVGHGITFDLQMLQKEAERHRIYFPLKLENSLDTLRLARSYGKSPSNALSVLAKHFNIPSTKAHRAMDDVLMNISVFKQLVRRYKTLEQLENILSKPIEMKTMPLGKHKGRLLSEIPLQYLQWAAGMKFDRDLLFSIRKEISRRKKGGGFAQATNPFLEL